MRATVRHTLWLSFACVVFATPGYAYLDPGTGSILLQSLLASVAVAMGVLRFHWHSFKAFLANFVASSAVKEKETGEAVDTESESQSGQ
ncbi:MAG: hypothetical protein KJO01_09280 [Gammaproteobacteria bacterium]|nr:hypothetical protein [Gammaproteobacteria bacterium]MBT8110452.1 hypothetical protein [Gammaproteobacteria bacterium]NNL45152.1 hypothetical protein [Woeseiaceae bacterium]